MSKLISTLLTFTDDSSIVTAAKRSDTIIGNILDGVGAIDEIALQISISTSKREQAGLFYDLSAIIFGNEAIGPHSPEYEKKQQRNWSVLPLPTEHKD